MAVTIVPRIVVRGIRVFETELISAVTLGTPRSNYTGQVGFKFTPSRNIWITQIGRWVVSGNSQSHTLVIYAFAGSVLASVAVNCSGATPGQFLYGTLATPLAVTSGSTYCCESGETASADGWYDSDCLVTASSGAVTINLASHEASGIAGTTNNTYGPVNFKYRW